MASEQTGAAPWRRQQSGDGGVSPPIGMAAPPPPPPPPPPMGCAPAQKLKCEIPAVREPPACVQNAMMTKDKKPFTYTPGGLDLSQIRSPRMARRLTRNAASEGVQQTHPQQSQNQQLQPQQNNGNVPSPVAPQIMHQVLPMAPPPPPPPPAPSSQNAAAVNRPHVVIPPPAVQQFQQNQQSGTPGSGTPGSGRGSLYVPPLDSPVTLNKAPTPWLTRGQNQQNQEQSNDQQQSPPWARQQQMQQQQQQSPQQSPQINSQSPVPNQVRHVQSPGVQSPVTNSVQRQASLPGSPRSVESPILASPLARQVPTPSVAVHTPQSPYWQPPPPRFPPHMMGAQQGAPQGTRVVPVQIEVQPVKQMPPSPQYQQQMPQYQQPPSYQQHQQQRQMHNNSAPASAGQQNSGPVTRIIPIQIEGDSTDDSASHRTTVNAQQRQMNHPTSAAANKTASPRPMFEDAPADQMRRMHLSDEDQALMGRVKQQVDGETFLHGEETDPRYRGAAIPSRAFRMLQTMTDPYSNMQDMGGAPADYQQRNGGPRFGRGPNSAIPSRSFQMLQAMVPDPSACGPGQSDM